MTQSTAMIKMEADALELATASPALESEIEDAA